MSAYAQTMTDNAAALGATLTWNGIGGAGIEGSTALTTLSLGPSGITVLREGLYNISGYAEYRLSGARAMGNVVLRVNKGAGFENIGPGTGIKGSATYHRSSGGTPATVQQVSVLPAILCGCEAGDVLSLAVERCTNATTNTTLTLIQALLAVERKGW